MRYMRRVSKIIRGRVAKWEPASRDPGNGEYPDADGKEFFWSDDPIFEKMSADPENTVLDKHGNRQWELKDGKVTQKTDPLTREQKDRAQRGRFESEYPQDRWRDIMADAEEARQDGAPADDPAFAALKAMQVRKRSIAVEVDEL